MIITKTPYRISFFGGGTDYPAWLAKHPGAVLSATIDKYCYISVRELPPYFEHKHRIVWSKLENVTSISEIQHPAAKACLEHLKWEQGICINHDGDLPAASGIGTSSSYVVGLLHALHHLRGERTNSEELAREAIKVEQDITHSYVGKQDQVAAAVGGLNLIEFSGKDGIHVSRINLNTEYQARFSSHLMLVFTGFARNASTVAASYQFDGEDALKAIYRSVFTGLEILKSEDWEKFGHILDKAWADKCQLSPEICNPYTFFLYERARQAGAWGGKLLGAGGGGFMLLVCPPEKQEVVRQALKGLLFVPFHFETKGSHIVVNGS